jgi:cell wall-associated NlpC family hydrolase
MITMNKKTQSRMKNLTDKREVALKLAVKTAWAYIGKPYIWGGDDPINGFDCSGFVIELLKTVGALPRDGDWTADGLYNKFKAYKVGNKSITKGCLVFWGTSYKMTHVEFAITAEHSIGASGGGSKTTDDETAAKQNAYIKVRPIAGRDREVQCVVFPFASIGI